MQVLLARHREDDLMGRLACRLRHVELVLLVAAARFELTHTVVIYGPW